MVPSRLPSVSSKHSIRQLYHFQTFLLDWLGFLDLLNEVAYWHPLSVAELKFWLKEKKENIVLTYWKQSYKKV